MNEAPPSSAETSRIGPEQREHGSPVVRAFFFVAGTVAFTLGIAGVFLPLLPAQILLVNLLGQLSDTGFPHFFLVSFAVKTPLPLLATDNDGARLRAAGIPAATITTGSACSSEERRGGKECRSRWAPYH